MHTFFSEIIDDLLISLPLEESHHAIKVLRLKEGALVAVSDGKGKWCEGTLVGAHEKGCLIKIDKTITQAARRVLLHVAIAPTKNIDRLEWFLEKATECGIDQITPVLCTNSERIVIKHERLQKVLVAAMKQSLRAYLPILNPAIQFNKFIEGTINGKRLIAHCYPGEKLTLESAMATNQSTIMLIGPEGDFTESEVEAACARGFEPVSLGDYRLRTETAALISCVCFNFANRMP